MSQSSSPLRRSATGALVLGAASFLSAYPFFPLSLVTGLIGAVLGGLLVDTLGMGAVVGEVEAWGADELLSGTTTSLADAPDNNTAVARIPSSIKKSSTTRCSATSPGRSMSNPRGNAVNGQIASPAKQAVSAS